MFEKYRNDVREFYEKQKSLGLLSMNLTYPTTARLRNECLVLFNDGCNDNDLRILTSFLGRPMKDQLLEPAIRYCDTDKFKALCNFLERDIKTSEKNTELLAWLINFKPRQYVNYLADAKKQRETGKYFQAIKRNFFNAEKLFGENCDDCASTNFNETRGSKPEEKLLQLNRTLGTKRWHKGLRLQKDSVTIGKEEKKDSRLPEIIYNEEAVTAPVSVTLEYPSGVKLSLATFDLDLISKLIRL